MAALKVFIITIAICLVVHSNNGEIRPGSHRSELDENTAFSEAEIRGSFVVTPASLSVQATLRRFRGNQGPWEAGSASKLQINGSPL